MGCGSDDDASAPAGGAGGVSASAGKAGSASGGKSGAAAGGKAGAGGGAPGTDALAGAGMGGELTNAGSGGSAGAGGAPGTDADIESLNALLSAEYNAITAYTAGAGLIGNAKAADPLYAVREVVTDVAVSIQAQHKLHAAALVDRMVLGLAAPGPKLDTTTAVEVIPQAFVSTVCLSSH